MGSFLVVLKWGYPLVVVLGLLIVVGSFVFFFFLNFNSV